MNADKITELFGDLFVNNLSIDFQTKITILNFGEDITDISKPNKKMIFENVVWQEFNEFDFANIFNSIEIDQDFDIFYKKHYKYFQKIENYLPTGKIDELKSKKFFFYTFVQTSGFNCFIITDYEVKIEINN